MYKNIIGYYRPAVLCALWNAANNKGSTSQNSTLVRSLFQAIPPMSLEAAEKIYSRNHNYDYINGKKMCFYLDNNTDVLDLHIYVRDHGIEALNQAFQALDSMPTEDYVHLKGFYPK